MSLSEESWSCEKCTFINRPTEIACAVCFTNRMVIKDLQTTWEWQADEKWIPYDYPTTLQIEDSYQKREPRVKLRSGFFRNRKGYEIRFEWEKGQLCEEPTEEPKPTRSFFSFSRLVSKDKPKSKEKMKKPIDKNKWICKRIIQKNTKTANERKVRRLGTDDESIFITIDQKILTVEDRCCVCQMTFIEEESDEEIEEKVQTLEKIKDAENVATKKNEEGNDISTKKNNDNPVIIQEEKRQTLEKIKDAQNVAKKKNDAGNDITIKKNNDDPVIIQEKKLQSLEKIKDAENVATKKNDEGNDISTKKNNDDPIMIQEEKLLTSEKIKDADNVAAKKNGKGNDISTKKNNDDPVIIPATSSSSLPTVFTSTVTVTTTTSTISCATSTQTSTFVIPTPNTISTVNKNKDNLVEDGKRDIMAKNKVTKVEEEEEEEDIIVKLPNCTNHYFHRECIAKWIKLKGFCPFCKKPI